MSRAKRFFIRTVPAAFMAGTLFGSVVTTVGAALKGSAIFRDVPVGHYADDAIGEMYDLGVIKGYDSAHFGPDDTVTRGQVALMMKRMRDEMKGITPSTTMTTSSRSSASAVSSSSVSSSSSSAVSLAYSPGGYVRWDSSAYNVEKNVATGELTVAIVRTGGNQGAGTVDYSFTGGTAVAGKNFTPVSGTIQFTSKQTSEKIKLKILNDSTTSGHKTAYLVLSKPTGAIAIGSPGTATVNITDPNSTAPVTSSSTASTSTTAATTLGFSASGYANLENVGSVTITVTRSGVTTSAVAVNYATVNGSAVAPTDYGATSGTLSFASGETSKTFTVSFSNNTSIEGNRSFNINLTNPTGGAGLTTGSTTVTINDDEAVPSGSGSIKFSTANYSVTESQGLATITVNHVIGFGAVSVSYSTSNGSAISGGDYTATNGTLSFAAGEVSKVFTIPIIKDSASEGEETVQIFLSGPTNGVTLIDPSTATLKIND